MKYLILFVSGAMLLAGCSSQRVRYHPVPPATIRKKPIIDVAPKETPAKRMAVRARYLKKRIAVARFGDVGMVEDVPFERDREIVARAGGPETVTEALINALHKSGRFDIVERKDIEAVLKEIKFGQSKWVERSNAQKAGDVLGAQCIIFASAGKHIVAAEGPSQRGDIMVYLRMVDVSTSRVTAAVAGAGSDLDSAVAAAVAQLVKASERTPWVGKIAKVETVPPGEAPAAGQPEVKEIVIDSGKDLGVAPDDTFAVFKLGDAIKDPDSGKILGYREEGAGVIRVVEVKQHFSIAKPVTLTRRVQVGDLVRPAIQD